MATSKKKLMLFAIEIFIVLAFSFLPEGVLAQSVSGNFSNTAMDLSNMPDQSISLTIESSSKATMGIRANKAKDSVVHINKYNEVETVGAGVFAGSKEKKWPIAKARFVTRTKSADGDLYKDTGIVIDCKELYYEGIVTDRIDLQLANGKMNWFHIAKPTVGYVESFTGTDGLSDDTFEPDRDFADGQLISKKWGKVEVLIVSSINQAQLLFVVNEKRIKDAAGGRRKIVPVEPMVIKSPHVRIDEEESRKDKEAEKAEKEQALEATVKKIEKETGNKMTTTPSGLRYADIKLGEGASPEPTDKVEVHYTGWLVDGTKFDSSVDRGKPATFGLNQVIEGWTEGVRSMKVGGKRKLLIPPDLGYGKRGRPPKIPPSAFLIFDIELLSIS